MASSNSPTVLPGESDDFLSSVLAPPAPVQLTAAFKLAELDVQQAQQVMLVIPADDEGGHFSLSSEILSMLRGEIQTWLKTLREQGHMVTELLSASARDQSVRYIAQKFLTIAYGMPSKAWMTTLPTGRQVVIAPSSVVNQVGFEVVCRVAHERAILTAQAHGQPYNTQALMHYQSARPMETVS